jgi:hypothetical protein
LGPQVFEKLSDPSRPGSSCAIEAICLAVSGENEEARKWWSKRGQWMNETYIDCTERCVFTNIAM